MVPVGKWVHLACDPCANSHRFQNVSEFMAVVLVALLVIVVVVMATALAAAVAAAVASPPILDKGGWWVSMQASRPVRLATTKG